MNMTRLALISMILTLIALYPFLLQGRSACARDVPDPVGIPIRARIPISSLPTRIPACGSYFLTNCLVGVRGDHGITIDADDVTIDLNGYTLIGVPGSGDGIKVVNDRRRVKVFNGTVRRWDGSGVYLGPDNVVTESVVESVVATENGRAGIAVGDLSIVSNCVATDNGRVEAGQGKGIVVRRSCVVRSCITSGNKSHGIVVGQNGGSSLILENHCSRNQGAGIAVDGSGNRIDCNIAFENEEDGIRVVGSEGNNLIVRNTSQRNSPSNYFIVDGNHDTEILEDPGTGFSGDRCMANVAIE